MKKKLLIIGGIVLVICVILVIILITSKKPETLTINIATKNGIKDWKLEDEGIVNVKKQIEGIKKNTMTDKTTGKTIVYEITDVKYDLTAKKKGKTTLTVEYEDYKTGETKKDIYEIEVDNKLKITVNKR